MNKEHIESFEFDNRRFINPNYRVYKNYNLKDKFYEEIGTGTVRLLINRSIEIQRKKSIDYFVRNDSNGYNTSKRELLPLLLVDGVPVFDHGEFFYTSDAIGDYEVQIEAINSLGQKELSLKGLK